jgi:hypothetical protein
VAFVAGSVDSQLRGIFEVSFTRVVWVLDQGSGMFSFR